MKDYVLLVVCTIVLCSMFSMILPSGRTGKFISVFIRLLCVTVIISPIFALIKNFEQAKKGDVDIQDNSYLQTVEKQTQKGMEESIENYLFEYEIVCECEVTLSNDKITPKQITIIIYDWGIYRKEENINKIEQIEKIVTVDENVEVIIKDKSVS